MPLRIYVRAHMRLRAILPFTCKARARARESEEACAAALKQRPDSLEVRKSYHCSTLDLGSELARVGSNIPQRLTYFSCCSEAVSYTHLTLPTKA